MALWTGTHDAQKKIEFLFQWTIYDDVIKNCVLVASRVDMATGVGRDMYIDLQKKKFNDG